MARYPQGVTSFIPAYQPYEVDFNYVNQVLGYKQNQYDQNWKQLNQLYGQLYYANVTHDMSEQKKQALIKDIDFNLKRVSGLDLSLEQNVNQAKQVFRPFYEDKDLMYDMAWTKNTSGQRMRGENFKNSTKKEMQSQYWDTGIKAIDYKIQEFKESPYEQIRSVGQASYTPYRNVNKEALAYAKEMGVDVQSVSWSPDGRYIITTQGGKQLEEPLSRMFQSVFGNDPGILDVYRTQAYVNRKDFAAGNAAQFNGDKNAAEMEYLKNSYQQLAIDNKARTNSLKAQSRVYDTAISTLQKKYDKTKDPQYADAIESYKLNKDIVDKLITQSEDAFSPDSESKTSETSSGFVNPYGDIATLRARVDAGMANKLMNRDINEAAVNYATTHTKMDVKADAYKVMEVQHGYTMAAKAKQHEYNMLEKQFELTIADQKKKIEDGVGEMINGQFQVKDKYNYASQRISADGTVTAGDTDIRAAVEEREQTIFSTSKETLKTTLRGLEEMIASGTLSDAKATELLGGKSIKTVAEQLQKDDLSTNDIITLGNGINNYFSTTTGAGLLAADKLSNPTAFRTSLMDLKAQSMQLIAAKEYDKKLTGIIEDRLVNDGYAGGKFLYDAEGNMRSKAEWQQLLRDNGLYDAVYSEYIEAQFKAATEPMQGRMPGSMIINKLIKDTFFNDREMPTDPYTIISNKANSLQKDKYVLKEAGTAPFVGVGFNETGMFANVSVFDVVPGYNTKNMQQVQQIWGILGKQDLDDSNRYSVSFRGTSKTAYDSGKANKVAGETQLFADFFRDLNFKDEGKIMGNEARIEFYPIAAGDSDTQAIKIRPSLKWMKDNGYIAGYNKDGEITAAGILSVSQAKDVLSNGATLFFEEGTLKGTAVADAVYGDPLKTYVDAMGTYTEVDPMNPNYKMTIEKGTFDGYNITQQFRNYDENTNTVFVDETSDYMNYQVPGKGLLNARNIFFNEVTPRLEYQIGEILKQQNK